MAKAKHYNCPIEVTLDVIGGKWKCLILWHLRDGSFRTGELRRIIPRISEKMLIQQLRELESDGIIHREVFQQVPPRVEYSLTQHGRTLNTALEALCEWGQEHSDYSAPHSVSACASAEMQLDTP